MLNITINDPNATQGTFVYGINDVGEITGYYTDGTGTHGFTAEPVPEPLNILGSLTAVGVGVVLHQRQKQLKNN